VSRARAVPFAAILLLATPLVSGLASWPSRAVTDPAAGSKDSRIRTTPYDPGQVVRLTSTGLSPLQVIFEDGERPVTIAGALVFTDPKEAKDWLARPSGNVLILQPLRAMEPSVLFVRTAAADGKERHYSFELRTREGSVADAADPQAYMTVRLTYPAVPTPEAVAAAEARREAARDAAAERAVRVRFAQTGDLGPRNYNYDKRDPYGCPLLAPVSVFDDGTRTTLLFAPHAVLPEVFLINQDGKEAVATTVNDSTPAGLRVMVPGVQREMRLRRGGKVCALRNNAFDPVGAEPGDGSGTISAEVVRRVRTP
jgi:type IV secretion system protein VirB9